MSDETYEAAIKESMKLCIGCAKKETLVISKRSSVVGLAAVHSSGMICIPWTIRALVAEAENRLDAVFGSRVSGQGLGPELG